MCSVWSEGSVPPVIQCCMRLKRKARNLLHPFPMLPSKVVALRVPAGEPYAAEVTPLLLAECYEVGRQEMNWVASFPMFSSWPSRISLSIRYCPPLRWKACPISGLSGQRNRGHLDSDPATLKHLLPVEDAHRLASVARHLIGHSAVASELERGFSVVHVDRVVLLSLERPHRAEHLGDLCHRDVLLRQPLHVDPVLAHHPQGCVSQCLSGNILGRDFGARNLHV